jgi:hypothetical protein
MAVVGLTRSGCESKYCFRCGKKNRVTPAAAQKQNLLVCLPAILFEPQRQVAEIGCHYRLMV